MALWTIHTSNTSSHLFEQVEAESPEEAVGKFFRRRPFRKLDGPESTWPQRLKKRNLINIQPIEEFPGVFECNVVNDAETDFRRVLLIRTAARKVERQRGKGKA